MTGMRVATSDARFGLEPLACSIDMRAFANAKSNPVLRR
jgi:hypothetical protein